MNVKKYARSCAASVEYLAGQGFAFRGDGSEADSMYLRALDDSTILTTLSKKLVSIPDHKYRMKFYSLCILRCIATSHQEVKFFSLMADEVTDSSNKKQFAFCFRLVDDSFQPNEDFIWFHHVESI